MKNPKTSLLITTYNWKEALSACLESILKQTVLPAEVIIADDGSRPDTKDVIDSFRGRINVPLKHVWQEDNGFRAARARNLGTAQCTSPYIIMIDGDLILHPNFVEDHMRNATKGCFLQGTRVITPEVSKNKILTEADYKFSIFAPQIRNRKNNIHSNLLCSLSSKTNVSHKGIRSCNMSFWKDDLIKVNGFNEVFTGWGREDSELVARLYNAGIKRKNVKFNCLTAHIYHNERSHDSLNKNTDLLNQTIDQKISRCELGLDSHLS